MKIDLLCEGVETPAHRDILLREDCIEAQGYLYGKPEPIEDIIAKFCHGDVTATRLRDAI